MGWQNAEAEDDGPVVLAVAKAAAAAAAAVAAVVVVVAAEVAAISVAVSPAGADPRRGLALCSWAQRGCEWTWAHEGKEGNISSIYNIRRRCNRWVPLCRD